MIIDLWPLIVYTLIVLAVVGTMLGLSYVLGQRRRDRATNEPYESGIVSVGDAHFRISVHFYLTAILFIIFDLEAVFLFAWAIAVRETGWLGFAEALIFILILLAGLVYLYKTGALDWRTRPQRGKHMTLTSPGGVVNINSSAKHDATQPPGRESVV